MEAQWRRERRLQTIEITRSLYCFISLTCFVFIKPMSSSHTCWYPFIKKRVLPCFSICGENQISFSPQQGSTNNLELLPFRGFFPPHAASSLVRQDTVIIEGGNWLKTDKVALEVVLNFSSTNIYLPPIIHSVPFNVLMEYIWQTDTKDKLLLFHLELRYI